MARATRDPARGQRRYPSETWSAPGDQSLSRGRKKLVVFLLNVFVEYLVGNLVELHVPGVRRLVVGGLAAKAEN